jgi:hypothetical protein
LGGGGRGVIHVMQTALSTKIIRRNIYYLQTLFKTNYVPIYQPKDWDGDVIKSYLRNNELQKVEVEADNIYEIDQILIRRTIKFK